jgi:hypothetical protein
MASVLEEVTAGYAVTEVAQVAFSDANVAVFAAVTFVVSISLPVFHAVTFPITVMVFAFVAAVQLAVVALRELAMISTVIRVRGRRAIVNACGRAMICHTRPARAALSTKGRARPAAHTWTMTTHAAAAHTWTVTSHAATTTTAARTAAVMLSVRACRENKCYRSCEYKFFHRSSLCVVSGELSFAIRNNNEERHRVRQESNEFPASRFTACGFVSDEQALIVKDCGSDRNGTRV